MKAMASAPSRGFWPLRAAPRLPPATASTPGGPDTASGAGRRARAPGRGSGRRRAAAARQRFRRDGAQRRARGLSRWRAEEIGQRQRSAGSALPRHHPQLAHRQRVRACRRETFT